MVQRTIDAGGSWTSGDGGVSWSRGGGGGDSSTVFGDDEIATVWTTNDDDVDDEVRRDRHSVYDDDYDCAPHCDCDYDWSTANDLDFVETFLQSTTANRPRVLPLHHPTTTSRVGWCSRLAHGNVINTSATTATLTNQNTRTSEHSLTVQQYTVYLPLLPSSALLLRSSSRR